MARIRGRLDPEWCSARRGRIEYICTEFSQLLSGTRSNKLKIYDCNFGRNTLAWSVLYLRLYTESALDTNQDVERYERVAISDKIEAVKDAHWSKEIFGIGATLGRRQRWLAWLAVRWRCWERLILSQSSCPHQTYRSQWYKLFTYIWPPDDMIDCTHVIAIGD